MQVKAIEPGSCQIQQGASVFELRIETPLPPPNHDWTLPAALPLAMEMGCDVQFEPVISPLLLQSVPTIQEIFTAFTSNKWKHVAVTAQRGPVNSQRNENVGLFFSGGVDSLYSLIKNQDSITHLVLVQGFDIRLDQTELFSLAEAAAQKMAAEFGKQLIVVRTNVRDVSNRYADWGMYHGAALAMAGHALSSVLGKCIIAATYTYAHLPCRGSHPLLDPLWSSERMSFVHDGLEANRMQKLALIAGNEAALSTLRVCWSSEQEYNCGHCEKCLRTMTALLAIGMLDACPTLPHRVDPALIRRIVLNGDPIVFSLWEQFEFEAGLPLEVRKAVSHVLTNYRLGLWPMTGVRSGFKRIKSYMRSAYRLTRAVLPGS
jgi:hypothetical protein